MYSHSFSLKLNFFRAMIAFAFFIMIFSLYVLNQPKISNQWLGSIFSMKEKNILYFPFYKKTYSPLIETFKKQKPHTDEPYGVLAKYKHTYRRRCGIFYERLYSTIFASFCQYFPKNFRLFSLFFQGKGRKEGRGIGKKAERKKRKRKTLNFLLLSPIKRKGKRRMKERLNFYSFP